MPDLETDLAWKATLASDGVGGLIATPDLVIVAGRDATDQRDRFSALDAVTGQRLWTYEYDAPADLDYGNSPRATPTISGGVLVTLGATGILSALDPLTGAPLWSTDLAERFGVEVPTWGFSGSPLVLKGAIHLQVGEDAALVAIDLISGKTQWRVPGRSSRYASLIRMDDERIVGVGDDGFFVRRSDDGSLLWAYESEFSGDFGVPSPVVAGDDLILTGENNGVALFRSVDQKLARSPVAVDDNLIPDTHTPVLVGDQLLVAYDGLHSLSIENDLRESWSTAEGLIPAYASIIASARRALVTTESGKLLLVDIGNARLLDERDLTEKRIAILSHPAVSGDQLIVRVGNEIRCYRLADGTSENP